MKQWLVKRAIKVIGKAHPDQMLLAVTRPHQLARTELSAAWGDQAKAAANGVGLLLHLRHHRCHRLTRCHCPLRPPLLHLQQHASKCVSRKSCTQWTTTYVCMAH